MPNVELKYVPINRLPVQGDNCGPYSYTHKATAQQARGLYIVRTIGRDGGVTSFSNQASVQ